MNTTQKVFLIVGITFGLCWVLTATHQPGHFFKHPDSWFSEWYNVTFFALSVGSSLGYFLFKD